MTCYTETIKTSYCKKMSRDYKSFYNDLSSFCRVKKILDRTAKINYYQITPLNTSFSCGIEQKL